MLCTLCRHERKSEEDEILMMTNSIHVIVRPRTAGVGWLEGTFGKLKHCLKLFSRVWRGE